MRPTGLSSQIWVVSYSYGEKPMIPLLVSPDCFLWSLIAAIMPIDPTWHRLGGRKPPSLWFGNHHARGAPGHLKRKPSASIYPKPQSAREQPTLAGHRHPSWSQADNSFQLYRSFSLK